MIRLDFPDFVPSRLFFGANVQTMCGAWLPRPPEPRQTVFHKVDTTLGDQLALHSNQPDCVASSRRQVVLLHGLAGCHGSSYVLRSCHRLLEAGFGVWRLDARGSGAGEKLARYHHHAGRLEDLQAAVEFVAARYPDVPVSVVGFSLGANVLLNYLGSYAASRIPAVDSAIAIAPPIDLYRCSEGLKRGLSRGYDIYFARLMLKRLQQRRRARPDMVDFPLLRKPASLKQFDSQFTVPAGGFCDIDDYYARASSRQHLAAIETPTLLLVDEHDPVVPNSIFDEAGLPPSIRLVRTRGGGHLGYIARKGIDPDRHWLHWRIADAIKKFDEASSNVGS